MIRLRGDALWLAVGVALLAIVTIARPAVHNEPSTYSSYDTGPNGYRAIYEVMRREGVATSRFERELPSVRSLSGTLVISEAGTGGAAFLQPPTLTAGDDAALARLVRGGAHLVVLGDVLPSSGPLALKTVAIAPSTNARAATDALSPGVTRVEGSFDRAYVVPRGARTLLTTGGHAVAVSLRVGKGSVVAVGSARVLSNGALARSDNARFAFDVFTGATPLLFDETVHGYSVGGSMWSVLPVPVHDAVWIAISALLLAVFGALFRSAPPVALEPERVRDSRAYLTSMARLLRRARAARAAIGRFARDADLLARKRPAAAKRLALAAELSQLEVLSESARPNDRALLDAARIFAHLRKELA